MDGEIVGEEIPWGNVESVGGEEGGGGGEGRRDAGCRGGHSNQKLRCNLKRRQKQQIDDDITAGWFIFEIESKVYSIELFLVS